MRSAAQRYASGFSPMQWVPSPLALAVLLTLLCFVLAGFWGQPPEPVSGSRFRALLQSWEQGIWNRGGMVFALQMAWILVLGHTLALSKPVQNLLHAALPRHGGSAQVAMRVALVSVAACLINWGMGLIAGALLARKAGEQAAARGQTLHYPLVAAAGYAGLMVWHGGLSGSAPLAVNAQDHLLWSVMGTLPLAYTLGSPGNLALCAAELTFIPLLFFWMGRRWHAQAPALPAAWQPVQGGAANQPAEPALPAAQQTAPPSPPIAPPDRNPALALALGLLLLAACTSLFLSAPDKGTLGFLTLDFLNLALLAAALVLHGNLHRFSEALQLAVPGSAGILIQFPLYFGIMGLMQDWGLVQQLALVFVRIADQQSFPLLGMLSAGLVNFLVPSGGGQWQVQGPILLQAGQQLGVDNARTVMALAYGDQLTNMLQPFWALPLLGITGLSARDILPFTFRVFLLGLVLFSAVLLIF
jgi:short-chain fatty acids transporter